MRARFSRSVKPLCRGRRVAAVAFLLTLLAAGSASVEQGAPDSAEHQ